MEDILESISNEICDKVRAKIDITKIFKDQPHKSIEIIKQSKAVLAKWRKEFNQTKREIEAQQTVKRWEF